MVCSDCAIVVLAFAAANAVLADCARLIASSSEMATGGAAACWAAHIAHKRPPNAPDINRIGSVLIMGDLIFKVPHQVRYTSVRLRCETEPGEQRRFGYSIS